MKSISKVKKQTVALALTLALGLVLSLSTGPVYGSPTVSTSPGGNTAQAAAPIRGLFLQAGNVLHSLETLLGQTAEKICFGLTSSTAAPTYPGNALDR